MSARLILNTLAPAGSRSRLSVLIFHRVLAAPDPLFPSEPDVARFDAQMRWVKDWFNVLPLAEAVRALRRGSLPARPLAITFDDGYADNATNALPILRRLGLPATFFIATGYLNGGRMFNDTVIEAVRAAKGATIDLAAIGLGAFRIDTVEAKRAALRELLPNLKYLPERERDTKAREVAACCGAELPDNLMLTDGQVVELDRAGMTIGAHTVTHPILARLPDEVARREIRESKDRLTELLGKPVTLFAYPNGKPGQDYTAAHVAMARELGFEGAVSTARGAAAPGCDLLQIPRFTPWDRQAWRFGLRLARNIREGSYATA